MAKGQQFERDICRKLSLWISEGKNDSLLWRTSNSGGRATVRGKKGKKTQGQYGDIAAIHPSAEWLTRYFTFELKRGYPKANLHDLIDGRASIWHVWIEKAKKTAKEAGSKTWAIIHKRNHGDTIILMPDRHMPSAWQTAYIHRHTDHIGIARLDDFLSMPPSTYKGEIE
jgi:hypothetical protein